MQKSADMIKTALNEVGCEELPSGCDDLSVDQNFIETNSPDQPVSLVNTNRFFLLVFSTYIPYVMYDISGWWI